MEVCRDIDAVLDTLICKNLFLCNRQKTAFYLLMMPGDKPFKTKELSSQINSARLSFADPEYMQEYLDIKPGAVSVMGLLNDKENHILLFHYPACHPYYPVCHHIIPYHLLPLFKINLYYILFASSTLFISSSCAINLPCSEATNLSEHTSSLNSSYGRNA